LLLTSRLTLSWLIRWRTTAWVHELQYSLLLYSGGRDDVSWRTLSTGHTSRHTLYSSSAVVLIQTRISLTILPPLCVTFADPLLKQLTTQTCHDMRKFYSRAISRGLHASHGHNRPRPKQMQRIDRKIRPCHRPHGLTCCTLAHARNLDMAVRSRSYDEIVHFAIAGPNAATRGPAWRRFSPDALIRWT
jgi:ribosomal protein L34E